MLETQESNETQNQLIEWIVAHTIAFSPSYFERQRIIFVNFFGPNTVFEFDGVQMHASDESHLGAKLSRIRKGNERFVFVATMEGNSSFRLRSMGMRGSGARVLYTFEVTEGNLSVELKSQMIMA